MGEKRFYVYEWFVVDTLEVFYVGKGTGNRRFELHNRNQYFKSIYNKYRCEVRLYKVDLTNEESCYWEIERIYELKMINQAKCNFTSGGTGFSTGALNPTVLKPHFGKDNGMIKHNIDMSGNKNPFYGKKHSDRTKRIISEKKKGMDGMKGTENPMYNKGHLVEGKNNGMYGVKGLEHPNVTIYRVVYENGESETLTYKECEKKFGIAFSRINANGGTLHYKKRSINSHYEGTKIIKINKIEEGATTIETT